MNLPNLSEAEMVSLLLNQEQESAIGDMHSQQQYREYLDHEVLSSCTAIWGEVLLEKGAKATRQDLENAFEPFFDVVFYDFDEFVLEEGILLKPQFSSIFPNNILSPEEILLCIPNYN